MSPAVVFLPDGRKILRGEMAGISAEEGFKEIAVVLVGCPARSMAVSFEPVPPVGRRPEFLAGLPIITKG